MNKITNKFLLTEDKFIPELHLKKPGFTDSVFGPFTNHRERIQSFREIGNLKHLCRSELDKVCFAHDATYFDSKDLVMKLLEIVDMMDINGHWQALLYVF